MDSGIARVPIVSKCVRSALLLSFVLISRTIIAAEPTDILRKTGRDALDASLRNDAMLADVFFADAATGWAVGDRGAIWHTSDGGNSWRQQLSGVACRINSVCFIDQRRGWAVGGASRPVGRASKGVVLRTVDGGTTWQLVDGVLLPLLTRVKFFGPNIGVAIGDCTSTNPSGAFATRDGGLSWHPLAAEKATSWLAGDFLDPDTGAVAGSAGQFATVARRQVIHSPLATPSRRSAHAMRLVAPAAGWLVGDGGLVMSTNDLGHSWQSPPADLPNNAGDQFDFHALAVHDSHLWVAGSPGTRVFHSADGGQTWDAFVTGSLTPLRAMTFVDAQRGWAVGDLGTILATTDGGQTWHIQRAGGQRAALLAVFAQASDVPLEIIAEQGAAEAYITAVDILHSRPDAIHRTREAMLMAGAAAAETAWRFPLPPDDLALPPDDVLAELNRTNDGRAMQQLQNHVVRQLRMWRPDVVVTHPPAPQTERGIAAMVEQLVLRSVEAAADAAQFAELSADIGLGPWQVKKVYSVLPPGSRGDEVVATQRFSPWLGATLCEWADPPRQLLFAAHTLPRDTYELRLLTGGTKATRGLFGGIDLAHSSDARRPPPELPTNDLDDLRRLATRRRHLEKLLERTEGNAAWAGQVATLIEGLDPNSGGDLLFQLAEGYRQKGRLDLAADTYYSLARRYPDHELTESALNWLVHFYASSETARRAAPRGLMNVRLTVPDSEVQQAAAIAPIDQDAAPAVGLAHDDRLRRAALLANYLASARPALYAEPAVRFAEVAAQRQLGYANAAKRYFLTVGQFAKDDPWRRCVETEQWLAKPGDAPPPKPLAACRRPAAPPHLDGQLDEPLWTAADRLRLNTTDSSQLIAKPTAGGEARLAYDNEFLYFAVTCRKAATEYPTDLGPRPRDADLEQQDRVTLRLDIDRDFSTAFELTVDHRGWTRDACWGDATWNPSWYVAAASDATSWTIEAAVPLAELTATPPAAKHVWAASVRRTIPRVGYESWAGATGDGDSPDQFGLLIFE